MFTIDLLKGQGVPRKKQEGMLIVLAASLALPAIILICLVVSYASAAVKIPVKTKQLKMLTASKADTQYAKLQVQIQKYQECLDEAALAINEQQQWSPIVFEIVDKMPDSLIMESFNASSQPYTEKIPAKDDPARTVSVSRIRRVINMTVFSEFNSGSDRDVQEDIQKYLETLSQNCNVDATLKNQQILTQNDVKIKKYQIQCIINNSN